MRAIDGILTATLALTSILLFTKLTADSKVSNTANLIVKEPFPQLELKANDSLTIQNFTTGTIIIPPSCASCSSKHSLVQKTLQEAKSKAVVITFDKKETLLKKYGVKSSTISVVTPDSVKWNNELMSTTYAKTKVGVAEIKFGKVISWRAL